MDTSNLQKLEDAYANFRGVFDRHFKSIEQAREIEARALAGDDRAQVRMYQFYRDAKEELIHSGSDAYVTRWRKLTRMVNCAAAIKFKKLAATFHNPDALNFDESVKIGNRISEASQPFFTAWDVFDLYEFKSEERAEVIEAKLQGYRHAFFPLPHPRYIEETWWDHFAKTGHSTSTEPPAIWFSELRPWRRGLEGGNPKDLGSFLKSNLSRIVPMLEICSSSGNIPAATELQRIRSTAQWKFRKEGIFNDKIFEVDNDFFSGKKADELTGVISFLSGQGHSELLDSYILSQDTTSEGLYNIGVCLFTNPHVRALYNGRLNRQPDDISAANDFLRHAMNLGNANAAWFVGNRWHEQAEQDNDPEKLGRALFYYRVGKEYGHPNAAHRYEYLTKKSRALVLLSASKAELTNPSSAHALQYPESVGVIRVGHYDYGFLNDAGEGDILSRIRRAAAMSDEQVADFERLAQSLEQKIERLFREAAIKTGLIEDVETKKKEGFAKNDKLLLKIGGEERQIQLSEERWLKEHSSRAAVGLLVGAATGDVGSVVTGIAALNPARAVGYGAVARNEQEYRQEKIASLYARLEDIELLKDQRRELEEGIAKVLKLRSIVDLQKDKAGVQRLLQGYLRRQVLEFAQQNCEILEKYALRAGLNSLDDFLAGFERAAQGGDETRTRVHEAVKRFCFGAADTNDLHVMMAYSDLVGRRGEASTDAAAARHDLALHEFSERHLKPSVAEYVSKCTRTDVLREAEFNLAATNADELVTDEKNQALAELVRSNFATEGSLSVNEMFEFYLHRHGKNDLRATRLEDGQPTDISERKAVQIWTEGEQEEFVERTIHFRRFGKSEMPKVDSIFLRLCAAEYFKPQSVITSGSKANLNDYPEAPVAYPIVNEVINDFIERMSLSPIARYREEMNDKRSLDALIAESFIDFFATLGHSHATQFTKEREDLARAYGLQHYGTRFRDCTNTLADDARERYALFKEIFDYNLQRTLEVSTFKESGDLLAQLRQAQADGVSLLEPANIVLPGTPEAMESAIRRDRRFTNVFPEFMKGSNSL